MTKKKTTKPATKTQTVKSEEIIKTLPPSNNQANHCQQKILNYIGCIFATPYNWSLILLTALMWWLSCYSSYNANANFDMLLTVNNYVFATSLVAIISGTIMGIGRVSQLGIVGSVLSILVIIMCKNFLTNQIGIFILMPANIFNLLFIAKNIWLANDERES